MGTTDDKADYIVTFGLVRQHKYLSHVKKKKKVNLKSNTGFVLNSIHLGV